LAEVFLPAATGILGRFQEGDPAVDRLLDRGGVDPSVARDGGDRTGCLRGLGANRLPIAVGGQHQPPNGDRG